MSSTRSLAIVPTMTPSPLTTRQEPIDEHAYRCVRQHYNILTSPSDGRRSQKSSFTQPIVRRHDPPCHIVRFSTRFAYRLAAPASFPARIIGDPCQAIAPGGCNNSFGLLRLNLAECCMLFARQNASLQFSGQIPHG